MTDVFPPETHADLLERPLFAHLATVRPDGSPQSSVMWFEWDGKRIRMTHTKTRQKFQNLNREPRIALSITDPEDGYRFLEVRGVVEAIEDDDAEAGFYKSLQYRYGMDYPIKDAAVRVIMTIRPTSFVAVVGGGVVARVP
ncbi:PPOX class F420-dependent oxidoreductase [Phytohabitans flavus]|uniref:PPOX class F420-dependent enzyme n=1 Tax=Phytohabitans flavus TaxID=1076124 RepID=A0A6F8Y4E1_9ACTN|nr:PPOX class F420-dependent oxidoreductase [Phytohabitans flavus]BCB80994.1 PPOX class F420-dependent enzyme [Phytohabitans flavus]